MTEGRKPLHILEGEEDDDPMLSVVNMVDVFLVIIAVLLIAVMENPLNPFSADNVIVIQNPGQADMQMTIKQGKELKKYQSSGQLGEGEGTKAGSAYRLKDGTMVYVPEEGGS